MKKNFLFLFAACLTVNCLWAQSCYEFDFTEDLSALEFPVAASVFSNGDVLVGLRSLAFERQVAVHRTAIDGSTIWFRRLFHIRPDVSFVVKDVAALPDNSSVVFGYWHDDYDGITSDYSNLFLIKLDPVGNVIWSRLYQSHFSSQDYIRQIHSLSNGGLVLGYAHVNPSQPIEYKISWLDGSGLPLRTRKFEWSGNFPTSTVDDDDNFLITINAQFSNEVMKFDTLGNVLWQRSYDYGADGFRSGHIMQLGNGNYLLSGNMVNPYYPSSTMLDGQGNFLTWRAYDTGSSYMAVLTYAAETASGDLVFGDQGNSMLFTTDGSGIPTSGVLSEPDIAVTAIQSIGSDSLLIIADNVSGPGGSSYGFVSTDNTDFSCAYSMIQPLSAVTVGAVTSQAGTFNVLVDSLQTWTMALYNTVPVVGTEVSALIGSGAMRPGFTALYAMGVSNLGTVTSGPLTVVLHTDTPLTFLNAVPPPSSVTNDSIVWTGLSPVGSSGIESIQAQFTISANVNLLGLPMTCRMTVSQDSTELDYNNNEIIIVDTIVGAYDPNDKLVSPEGLFDIQNDSTLFYTIRFQNTGTDTAFNITVVDTLPQEVSVSSFIQGPGSHPYTHELGIDGILKFHFNNILLPDSNTNEALSHGLVSFSVRPDNGLAIGTMISNEADIYFDFNPPVRTPPAIVAYGLVTGLPAILEPNELSVYPVPVDDFLTIVKPADFASKQLLIHSLDGRLIQVGRADYFNEQAILPVNGLSSGQYVLTLVDKAGKRLYARFVKE